MKVCPECKGLKFNCSGCEFENMGCDFCQHQEHDPCETCNGTGEVMNIELIKYMVGYADGFEIVEDKFLQTPFEITYNLDFIDNQSKGFNNGVLPYLFTRCIEGINRDITHIRIRTGKKVISVFDDRYASREDFLLKDYETIDEAKLAAITYIYNKEIGE